LSLGEPCDWALEQSLLRLVCRTAEEIQRPFLRLALEKLPRFEKAPV